MIKEKNRCSQCGHIIDKREIALFVGMRTALWIAYRHCLEKGKHNFRINEIKDKIGKNEYARFGDWVYFGGLVYKNEKCHYGLNMERCDKFFKNEISIPMRVWKDPLSGEIADRVDYKFARQIPDLMEFLNKDGLYEAKYKGERSAPVQQKIKKIKLWN